MDEAPRYWAFISYSHSDRKSAHWLHHALETYSVPARLVGRPTAAGRAPRRFRPIFRDRAELAANADLKARVQADLARSAWLIVICSPAAASSPWVADEIVAFKAIHGEDRVLAVIVAGEPFASASPGREGEECFPAALRFRLGAGGAVGSAPAEPVAADLRAKGDGRRLARLKLLAGMLGVGLDELVRRDAQRRQRELTVLAAASLVGAVAMGALATSALIARDEARRERVQAETRRAQAEGLVGFMLDDLRYKLDATGRIDLLDAVARRAMAYYTASASLGLDADALGRRARVLHLLGDLSDRRGDLSGALGEFRQAYGATAELLARQPANPRRLFDHAYSAYWVGWIAYQRGRMDKAIARFGEYKRLADRLVRIDPKNDAWRSEAAYADSNLQNALLEEGRAPSALAAFFRSSRISQEVAAKAPGDRDKQMDVANSYMWLAKAQTARGDLPAAMADLLAERAIYEELLHRQAGDRAAQAALEVNQVAVANLLDLQGRAGAPAELKAATAEIDRLMAVAPDNTVYWEQAAAAYAALSQALLKEGSKEAAWSAATRAGELAEALARKAPAEALWQGALLGTARAGVMEAGAERAKTAARRRDALSPAPAEARRLAALANQQPANRALARTAAELSLLAGDEESLEGHGDQARAAWRAALERLGRVGLSTASPLHDRGQLIASRARARLAGSGRPSAEPDYGW
jgi:eukaryotic-like serine/threonine-protein kinase